MKLQYRLISLIVAILVISIGSIMLLSHAQMKRLMAEQFSKDLLDVSRTVAENGIVKQYLEGEKGLSNEQLNKEIGRIKERTHMNFIVIMNMEGIRQTHPVWQEIGKKFEGGDERRVLENGEEYTSEARGTLGTSYRAFAPIYDGEIQIGAVCVGVFKVNYNTALSSAMKDFIPFIGLGFSVGIMGAIWLSYRIKVDLFGLEPEEIALILKQKETVLENVREGIVSLDRQGRIQLFNREAGNIIGLKETDIGKPITDYVEGSRVPEVLRQGQSLENVEVRVKPGLSIMSKISLLKNDKQQTIGVLISFRNLTEIQELAEELTGVKKMAWSLRAQNHEFMNKLHTIAGLIQLEEYSEALNFISAVAKDKERMERVLSKGIQESSVAAILLSKYHKAEENRVGFFVDSASKLEKLPDYMTSLEAVTIIGNLIENALDAVSSDGNGRIYVKLIQDEGSFFIEVSDNGMGIDDEVAKHLYEQGFSTKEGQRGDGLYNIKAIIDALGGKIQFKHVDGTTWYVSIPMKRGKTYD